MNAAASLSSDRPSTDPAEDLFGHAPFAKTLARALTEYGGSDGMVVALYGPWGAGKSTVLAYVQHELELLPEAQRPVIVSFNPWWFSGLENLAKAFLGQLQAVLPSKYSGFKKIGTLLADFSSALGGAVEIAGKAFSIPGIGKIVEAGFKMLGARPKDVPALKKALSDVLMREKKRVLVVIDDIDRLTPDEVRQLFTVIKALADFPYVTYLLAFDREVAVSAINSQTGLPGARYLEKIIQVPFELPRVDLTTLQQALFMRLDTVLSPLPEGRFDNAYWTNVFFGGLAQFFAVPRDVVRFTNAISFTYPAVAGEVNPVDFIAIECLRVFVPTAYDAIRTSPSQFWGYQSDHDQGGKQRAAAFHEAWLSELPEALRAPTKDLLEMLFPRLQSVWSNVHHSAESFARWRTELRVCVEDVFPAYVRLALPRDAVSRAEIDALLQQGHDPAALASTLRQMMTQNASFGPPKVRALLDRFMDHVSEDLDGTYAEPVIAALMDVGDELLIATGKSKSVFDFGNESRVMRIAYHLLKKVSTEKRAPLMANALKTCNALRCSQYLLGALGDEAEKADKGEDHSLLSSAEVDGLKAIWCQIVQQRSTEPTFIDHPSLAPLLDRWRRWSDDGMARAWWETAAESDEGLLKLIASNVTESRSQTFGEHAVRVRLGMNLKNIQRYADPLLLAPRVEAMLSSAAVPDELVPAAKQFIVATERYRNGVDPDAVNADDD